MRNTPYDRYARLVTRFPKAAILVALLSVLALGYAARDVRLDNNFAALFSTSSEAARFREAYRRTFGADDGLLVASIEGARPEDPRFAQLVAELSRRAAEDPSVRRVYSPSETSVVFRSGDAALIEPAFGGASSQPGEFRERLARVLGSPLGGTRLVSRDGHVFLVVAELEPSIDSYERILAPAQRFEALVRAGVAQSGLPVELHFAGIPFTRIAAIASMQGDLLLLTPLTTVALGLILFVFLRRSLAVLIPLLCVTAAVVGTAGVIGLCGDDLNQLTVVYPILLMVITVATAIHQVHRFQHEFMVLGDVRQAALVAAARTTEASMLQTLTTVFGFGSLITSSMHILHGFGVYLASGVALAFFYVATLVPALLVLWGRHVVLPASAVAREVRTSARHERFVRALVSPGVSRAVTLGSLLAFAVLCVLARGIVYDYRLSDNVPRGHDVEAGNALIDTRLTGIVPIEVAVDGAPQAFRQPANLARVAALAKQLETVEGVRQPISLTRVLSELSHAFGGADETPPSSEAVEQLLLFAEGSPDRVVEQLATPDFARTRIRGTIPDHGAVYVGALSARFQAFSERLLAGSGLTARMTGEAPVAYEGMNRLSEELLTSELWALGLVTLAIGVVFRSARIALASILPNALPVLIALSLYALTGRAIDPLPGIVFCIGIGIAVDDTIHVIARYREELRTVPDRREAMVRTMTAMSGALFSSSASIAAGFAMLCLSDFNMNRTMGWLGALMLGLAWLFEWVCTPAALVLFDWRVTPAPAPGRAVPLAARVTGAALVLGLLALPAPGLADVAVSPPDARAIMEAVHARDLGDRMRARLHMTITGSGPARARDMRLLAIDVPGGMRRLIQFEAPADVRNTGLLTLDYDDGARADEQWLYLPALHQTTRIATARRSGAFAGSDFSYADLTRPDPALYTHELLRSEQVDGEDCWVIASLPRSEATAVETGYTRTETWVGKRSAFPRRVKASMAKGRTKYIAATGVRALGGVLTAQQITARVVFEGKLESQTVLEQHDVAYGVVDVTVDELSEQRLERGL